MPASQTGVGSGMNTVLRTLGGALGGQIAATFVAANTVDGPPTLTGFTRSFAMSALVLAGCAVAGLLIPARPLTVATLKPAATPEPGWPPPGPSPSRPRRPPGQYARRW